MTPFLLRAHLRFDERGDKARHRRFEIAGAARTRWIADISGCVCLARLARSGLAALRLDVGSKAHLGMRMYFRQAEMTEGEPHMPAKVQAAPWLTTGWVIAQSGMASDPIDPHAHLCVVLAKPDPKA